MTFIKKLVMHGFKSFPRKTEIPFTSQINVILGPNGSGKSNISDALCFVLGRLSIKSMRAAKASNLIFLGSKAASPAKEAGVEIVFENSGGTFSVDKNEVSIKRIVRKNGQSIYKINDETKTRQEVLFLLAQAGIDSNGFNIILQGEIQNFVRMHQEERRKVVEEVSGISVYETRREKSLKELEKTEDRLKEVYAILRERTSYLNNLERERQQALKFKKLENEVKKFRASIINFDVTKKKKENEAIESSVSEKEKEIEKVRKAITEIRASIMDFESRISSINSAMQKSAGFEQEKLNQEIANLRAEIAGINVKVENYAEKISNVEKQKSEVEIKIREGEVSLKELKKDSPAIENKQKDVEAKKKELEKLEEQRKKFYTVKSELKSTKERLEEKKSLLQSYANESDFILRQTSQISEELFDKKTDAKKIGELKSIIAEKRGEFDFLAEKESKMQKILFVDESEVEKNQKLVEKISKIDICPVCKSKITQSHVHSIENETGSEMSRLKKEIENCEKELGEIAKRKECLKKEMAEKNTEILKRESDLVKISGIEEKKERIKNLQAKSELLKGEISEMGKNLLKLEKIFEENSNVEEKYETAKIEVQEISLRSGENLSSEVSFKERELERLKISLKQLLREKEDLGAELSSGKNTLKEKEKVLEAKKKLEEELTKKFQELIVERDGLQKKIRENETGVFEKQKILYGIEQEINNFNIEKARIKAEIENLETDMLEFQSVEIIKANRDSLANRLNQAKEMLSKIGSVNLLSLDVYDNVKKEYDSVKEKAEVVEREKESIMKTINEIDGKKKKTFMKTLDELNGIFSRNFSDLSQKGFVSLELEDKKEPFNGGVDIIVKTGHGKYFDVGSLSGGEQTLVALSLIFAIQELKPYHFYILDEVDAALDKRNSERLSDLLKKHMKKGQYIIITHNDDVILNASNLYGVSMHEGISKVISMKV